MSKKEGKKHYDRSLAPNKDNGDLATGNQWTATPRQLDWLEYYMNPRHKETYANPYQAAIKAGYSESYAKEIMSPSTALQWVKSARNIMKRMNTEHLVSQLEEIATNKSEVTKDRIAAIKLLGIDMNMFVQKQVTAHIGLEEAMKDLE